MNMTSRCVWTTVVAAAAGLMALTAPGQERRSSVGFINMDRAFNEYYKTKMADAQLKAQAKEFDEEHKKMVADLERIQKEWNSIREEAQNTALSEEVRAAKRTLAEEKLMVKQEQEGKIRRFMELRQKQLEDQSRRMRKGLVEEIRNVLRTFARERGFDAVFDSSGPSLNGVETVLYSEPRSDITDEILKVLNQNQGGAAPAEPAKKP